MRRQAYILKSLSATLIAAFLMSMLNFPIWGQFPIDGLRRPQYAGSWYESDAAKLKAQLDHFFNKADRAIDEKSVNDFLADVENPQMKNPVLAIVVPHAGYVFSGQTAAFAYKVAREAVKPKRIFLLGPSHQVAFRGAALPLAIRFQTPLGDLDVDKDVIAELKAYPLFSTQPEVHRVEHSLELQLPLIKYAFPDVKIVPIVVGQLEDESDARLLGEVLKGFVGKDDLVVVSSDFTHYGPRYGYIPFREKVVEGIKALDREAFVHLSKIDLDSFTGFQRKTGDTICGFTPCQVLCAMLPAEAHGSMLKYATSRESGIEDSDNSVSYLSVAFSSAHWPAEPSKVLPAKEVIKLSDREKNDLLKLAQGTVESWVRSGRVPSPEELGVTVTPPLKQCFGVFVTLNKKSTNAAEKCDPKDLRGCIGSIYPVKQLWKSVQENAVSACSKDYRFSPVTADELSTIEYDLNVLTPPRRIASYKEIVIGRDGIIMAKHGRQAVFLPQVPVEWGWNLEQTLSQLSQKAGLSADAWKDGAKFDVFQSESIHP